MSPLAWFVCVIVGAAGYGIGALRYNRYGVACYKQALVNIGLPGYEVQAELDWWLGKEDDDGPEDQVRDVPPAAGRELGDDGGGEGASGVLAGGPPHPRQLDPPRPGRDSSPDSEHGLVSQPGSTPGAATGTGPGGSRGYGPYLAAIGRDDPAGWYANLTAGEPAPEPGPAPEAAWLERQLYEGAVWSARLESWGSRFTDAFHADVAAWDRMAARWQEQARFMVESRRWPPKMLEAAT